MKPNFLIQDKFLEFNFNTEQEQHNFLSKLPEFYINKNIIENTTDYSSELIEEIDDNNYNLYEQEIKYKIFEDISSVNKKNDIIELMLNIPINDNIMSINKIKLSTKLNKYIYNIYVCVDGKKIVTQTDFLNDDKNNIKSTIFDKQISSNKIINCQYSKNVTFHILFKNNVINKIINKNIFVNYSFAILKNKLKFM